MISRSFLAKRGMNAMNARQHLMTYLEFGLLEGFSLGSGNPTGSGEVLLSHSNGRARGIQFSEQGSSWNSSRHDIHAPSSAPGKFPSFIHSSLFWHLARVVLLESGDQPIVSKGRPNLPKAAKAAKAARAGTKKPGLSRSPSGKEKARQDGFPSVQR